MQFKNQIWDTNKNIFILSFMFTHVVTFTRLFCVWAEYTAECAFFSAWKMPFSVCLCVYMCDIFFIDLLMDT